MMEIEIPKIGAGTEGVEVDYVRGDATNKMDTWVPRYAR